MITIGSAFSGIGGFELGLMESFRYNGRRSRTIWQIEKDPYCQRVLKERFPSAVQYDDITTCKHLPSVDVVCGGFPCQDLSSAGKRTGLEGSRSGLFYELSRVVRMVRPTLWIMENVSGIYSSGLRDVLREVSDCGYDGFWTTLRASDVGAPHKRARWFFVGVMADADGIGSDTRTRLSELERTPLSDSNGRGRSYEALVDADGVGLHSRGSESTCRDRRSRHSSNRRKCQIEPGMGRNTYGISVSLDSHKWPSGPGRQYEFEPPRTRSRQRYDIERLKALGNSIVPQCSFAIGNFICEELLR